MFDCVMHRCPQCPFERGCEQKAWRSQAGCLAWLQEMQENLDACISTDMLNEFQANVHNELELKYKALELKYEALSVDHERMKREKEREKDLKYEVFDRLEPMGETVINLLRQVHVQDASRQNNVHGSIPDDLQEYIPIRWLTFYHYKGKIFSQPLGQWNMESPQPEGDTD